MKTVIDIKKIHLLNLFESITKVKTTYCFTYGNIFFFMVEPEEIKKIKGLHIRILSKKLGKKVKIIPIPKKTETKEIEEFLKIIKVPETYKKMIVKEKQIIFFIPSTRSKSIFFGKNKERLKQLQEIFKNFFDMEVLVK